MTISHDRREELLDLAAELDDSPIRTGPSMAGEAIRELLTALELAEEWADEQSYPLVRAQGEILTGVAMALNGPPPPLTSWSHHDLAEKAARAVADRDAAEARIKAVQDVLDAADKDERWWVREWGHHAVMTADIRRALEA